MTAGCRLAAEQNRGLMKTKITPVNGHRHNGRAARDTVILMQRELAAAVAKFGKHHEEVAELMHSQGRIYREFPIGYRTMD